MKEELIGKIRKVSLRYGFYSHLVRAKVFIDRLRRKSYKYVEKQNACYLMTSPYRMIEKA